MIQWIRTESIEEDPSHLQTLAAGRPTVRPTTSPAHPHKDFGGNTEYTLDERVGSGTSLYQISRYASLFCFSNDFKYLILECVGYGYSIYPLYQSLLLSPNSNTEKMYSLRGRHISKTETARPLCELKSAFSPEWRPESARSLRARPRFLGIGRRSQGTETCSVNSAIFKWPNLRPQKYDVYKF